MTETIEIARSVPVLADVDVLVVGAGIAGATAAVASARNGATTMLVDRFGSLGGNMGPGMIGGAPNLELPASMADGMPGIPGEFVRRCSAYTNAPLFNHYFRDAQVISYVWLQMMQESGVRLLLNAFAADPIMDGNTLAGLVVETKLGTRAVRARVVIDATGDADVAARAGAPTDDGAGLSHSGVYWAVGNVDVEQYYARVRRREPGTSDLAWADGLFAKELGRPGYQIGPALRELIPYFRPAWESGEFRIIQKIGDAGIALMDHGIFRSTAGVQDVDDPIATERHRILGALVGVYRPESRATGDTAVMNELEIGCRTYIFEAAQWLRRRVPGFENSYLHIIAPYFHSRGGRSIVSRRPITVADVKAGRKLDDVVFVAIDDDFWELCLPGKAGPTTEMDHSFDFPYRQLLPREVQGLLVTGRAAIIQPPVMRPRWQVFLMGQAAGVAAALAARADLTPDRVNVTELQRLLHREYQAPLGDDDRLQELGIT